MAEEGGRGETEPSEGSKFWYVPTVVEMDKEVPVEFALELHKRGRDEMRVELGRMEDENKRIFEMSVLLKKRVAELEEEKLMLLAQCNKVGEFALGEGWLAGLRLDGLVGRFAGWLAVGRLVGWSAGWLGCEGWLGW